MNTAIFNKTIDRIEEDLQLINSRYGLLAPDQHPLLLKDIKYLLLDNIAKKVRLVFHDRQAEGRVLLEYAYTLDGFEESQKVTDAHLAGLSDISFDIFIEFTDAFLALDKKIQTLMLHNTEFEWYPYS